MQPRAAHFPPNESAVRAHRARAAARASNEASGLFDNTETCALQSDLVDVEMRAESEAFARAWAQGSRRSVCASTLIEASRNATEELSAAVLAKDWLGAARLAFEGALLDSRAPASALGLSALEALDGTAQAERRTFALVAVRVAGAQRRAAVLAEGARAAGAATMPLAGDRLVDEASPLAQRAVEWAESNRPMADALRELDVSDRDVAVEAARLLSSALGHAVARSPFDDGRLAVAESLADIFGDRLRAQEPLDALDRALRLAVEKKAAGWAERLRSLGARDPRAAAADAVDIRDATGDPNLAVAPGAIPPADPETDCAELVTPPRRLRASPFVAEAT